MKGELIAWREWRLTEDNKLHSVSMDTVWDGPHMKADVAPAIGELVSFRGSRGLYFLRRRKHAMSYGGEVIGCAALYGKVVEHEKGFRAEECMVRYLELHESVATPEMVKALESRYGCTVKVSAWKRHTAYFATAPSGIVMLKQIYASDFGKGVVWNSDENSENSSSPTPTPSPSRWKNLCRNVGNWFLRRAA